jgi:hypothetical protein
MEIWVDRDKLELSHEVGLAQVQLPQQDYVAALTTAVFATFYIEETYANCWEPLPNPATAEEAIIVGIFWAARAIIAAMREIMPPKIIKYLRPNISERPL